MSPRYQVFISSTFTDLQNERALVQNMLMKLDYIPAGMELFPAIDEEQLAFIKRIIDDSDYYLLIIAGRYGSVGKDGISYTEKEYDYAISKGMKVIALIHKNPQNLSLDNSEKDAKSRKSLEKFRKKVMQSRLVSLWDDASQLPGLIAQSLPVTAKTYPAIGWVRASSVPGPEIYKELNDLRKENDLLKKELANNSSANEENIADLENEFAFSLTISMRTLQGDRQKTQTINTSWGTIFNIIAGAAFIQATEGLIKRKIVDAFADRIVNTGTFTWGRIDEEDIQAMRIQFRALDLITLTPYENVSSNRIERGLIWSLTPTGEKVFVISKAFKRV